MFVQETYLILFIMKASAVFAFAPPVSIYSAANVAMTPTTPSVATTEACILSKSLLSDANSVWISIAEEHEIVARQSLINWDHPGQALLGSVFLLYVVFSILAGIKYVIKDGWRPKF